METGTILYSQQRYSEYTDYYSIIVACVTRVESNKIFANTISIEGNSKQFHLGVLKNQSIESGEVGNTYQTASGQLFEKITNKIFQTLEELSNLFWESNKIPIEEAEEKDLQQYPYPRETFIDNEGITVLSRNLCAMFLWAKNEMFFSCNTEQVLNRHKYSMNMIFVLNDYDAGKFYYTINEFFKELRLLLSRNKITENQLPKTPF